MQDPHPSTTPLQQALQGRRIPGLDALRALSILLVIGYHLDLGWYGATGVEIFFVLSGFLITWLLLQEQQQHGRLDLPAFYVRRAARLLPGLVVLVAAGGLYLKLSGRELPWTAMAATLTYVINYYQAATGAGTHYLSHAWSLAVEEQFYLLWPLLLVLAARRGWPLARTLVLLIGALWAWKTVLVLGLDASDEYLYRALDARADQLLAGALCAVLLRRPAVRAALEHWPHRRLSLLGLVLLFLLVIHHAEGTPLGKYVIAYGVEPLLVAAAIPLLILEAQGGGWLGRCMEARPVVLIGQVSYGMYLYHGFVAWSVHNAVLQRSGSPLLACLAALGAIVAVAWLSWRALEQPMRHWLCQAWAARRGRARGVAALGGAAG